MRHAACVASIAVFMLALAGCGGQRPYVRASGVVEMDEIDVASLEGGRVVRLSAD